MVVREGPRGHGNEQFGIIRMVLTGHYSFPETQPALSTRGHGGARLSHYLNLLLVSFQRQPKTRTMYKRSLPLPPAPASMLSLTLGHQGLVQYPPIPTQTHPYPRARCTLCRRSTSRSMATEPQPSSHGGWPPMAESPFARLEPPKALKLLTCSLFGGYSFWGAGTAIWGAPSWTFTRCSISIYMYSCKCECNPM